MTVAFRGSTEGLVAQNNIIYGFAAGVTHAATNTTTNYSDYNDYYNNTSDVGSSASWQKGANDLAVSPSFANVVHRVAVGDFIYISAGTGTTTGIYGIVSVDSETQLTLDLSPGTFRVMTPNS